MARLDPHSFADADQPSTRSLEWRARVDFPARVIAAEATLRLDRAGHGPLDLDTRDLSIDAVTDAAGRRLAHELGEPDPVLGARLRVTLTGQDAVRIRYRTAKASTALQWLEPEQTAGKREPFLFSQCQAIHARSVVPLQDTPRVRITYTAELAVPAGLRGLMAAQHEGRDELGPEAIERWRMPHPIAPYLFALAAGRLESRDVGPISRVWAEPEVVEAAAWEFADVARMVDAGEALFGPYDWGRFDVLVMPPSFPYGGMENPCLTFLTPTLLAKDRSLVNVLAHELAHSWTGNLVTSANAEHFWLNEGFTVYAERRIVEALEGIETRELHAALGRGALEQALAHFADRPQLTRLRTDLAGVDPDDAFSSVPYEKGYLLLRALEEDVGRDRFDAFLKAYLREHAFRAITTDDFVATCERALPGALARVHAARYFDEPGVPSSAPVARSRKLDAIRAIGARAVTADETRGWSASEWQLYLDGVPRPAPPALVEEIERRFNSSASGNAEVLVAWLSLAVQSGHAPSYAVAALFLERVGRMKYLRPLYKALLSQPDAHLVARAAFERARGGYHPIARQLVEGLLAKAVAA
jgi:aminopeptidase N